jgi:hypothetical protein
MATAVGFSDASPPAARSAGRTVSLLANTSTPPVSASITSTSKPAVV